MYSKHKEVDERGLFDKLASAVKNFDYEGAADSLRNEYERKQSSIERSADNKFRDKARNATDDELRHNLQNAIDNIHTVLHQVLQLAVEDNYIRQNISDNLLKELKSSHHYEDAHRRALNNTSYVHPDTKKKIFKAVGQLSYRPNLLAKGLKQGIGVLRVLKESGKKVPEEVMVISLTGHAIGGMIETAMTSMELPGREMGQWAADMILEDIEAEK
ncbi:LacI family transcriptional regulator [Ruminococcus sp. AF12-5]|nr:LacI family transcriptional regulator [Ruminococcus sp. AF12-5]